MTITIKNTFIGKKRIQDIEGSVVMLSLTRVNFAYSGQCLRLRRSGDNAESDFGFVDNEFDISSAQTWIDAGGGTQIGYVAKWYDQSGYVNDATQSTAGNQPEIDLTGTPFIEFKYANQNWLEIAHNNQFNFDGLNYTWGIKGRSYGCIITSAFNNFLAKGEGAIIPYHDRGIYLNYGASSEVDYLEYKALENLGAETTPTQIDLTQEHWLTGTFNPTTRDVKLYQDTTILDSLQSTLPLLDSDNTSNLVIGGSSLYSSRNSDIDVYGVLIMNNKDLSLSEITDLVNENW